MSIKIIKKEPSIPKPITFPIITKDTVGKHYITSKDTQGNYVSICLETSYFGKSLGQYEDFTEYLTKVKEIIVEAEIYIE